MGVGGDDDLAAHLLHLAQQPCAGVEILAVTAVDAAGVHLKAAVMLLGCYGQCLEAILPKPPVVRLLYLSLLKNKITCSYF